jgi:hypothetical protein
MFLTALFASVAISAVPKTDPKTWISTRDYPESLVASDTEGVVKAGLAIDERGIPGDCHIISSSGEDEVDKVTCRLLVDRGRFAPARGRDGRPAKSNYILRVAWKIPREKLITRGAKLTFPVGADGTLTGCSLEKYGSWEEELNCDPQGVDVIADELLPAPRTSYKTIGFLIAMEVDSAEITLTRPDDDDRAVLGRAFADVSGAGVITRCTTDVAVTLKGQRKDMCSGLFRIGDKEFDADPHGKPRRLTITLEISGARR